MANCVWMRKWEESERGWGVRPDGASLHATREDVDRYVSDYWRSMPSETPDEYSRPCAGEPVEVAVPQRLYDEVVASKAGVRLWQHQLPAAGIREVR